MISYNPRQNDTSLLTPNDVNLFIHHVASSLASNSQVLFNRKELAKITGKSLGTVANYIRRGMPHIIDKGEFRVNLYKAIEWMKEQNIEYTVKL